MLYLFVLTQFRTQNRFARLLELLQAGCLQRSRDAAIDIEHMTVDEGGRVGRKKHRRADKFRDIAPAPSRRALRQPC